MTVTLKNQLFVGARAQVLQKSPCNMDDESQLLRY